MMEEYYAAERDLPEAEQRKLFNTFRQRYDRDFKDKTLAMFRAIIEALTPDERDGLPSSTWGSDGTFETSELGRQVAAPLKPFDIIDAGEWLRSFASNLSLDQPVYD
jgi:hypothetical protein